MDDADFTDGGSSEEDQQQGAKPKRARKKKDAGAGAKAATPKRAKKPKQPKQERIPGTERLERNEAIERAAVAYVEVRDERMELTKAEVKAKAVLHDAMKQAGLQQYICDSDDLEVVMKPAGEESVKVKRRKVELDDDVDDAGGNE